VSEIKPEPPALILVDIQKGLKTSNIRRARNNPDAG
jgi:hypothetical protein